MHTSSQVKRADAEKLEQPKLKHEQEECPEEKSRSLFVAGGLLIAGALMLIKDILFGSSQSHSQPASGSASGDAGQVPPANTNIVPGLPGVEIDRQTEEPIARSEVRDQIWAEGGGGSVRSSARSENTLPSRTSTDPIGLQSSVIPASNDNENTSPSGSIETVNFLSGDSNAAVGGGSGAGNPSNDNPGNDDPGNDDPGNDDPGNDDPGNDDPGNSNRAPVVTQPVVLEELLVNQSVIIPMAALLQNASDPDGDEMLVKNLEASSGILLDNSDDSWTFTPDTDDESDVTFTYEVSDGIHAVPQTASLDLVTPSGEVKIGGDGADTIIGTPEDDYINAYGGDDTVYAREGDDVIEGRGGDDSLHGGKGNDVLFGGEGNDNILGGDDEDVLFGGKGSDNILGGEGDDSQFGDDGDDTLLGGEGDDKLFGNEGDDALFGDEGDDRLFGDDGDDRLRGGDENDKLYGGDGDDRLRGGDGDDKLYGGDGDDRLRGGDGDDVLDGGAGDNQLRGEDGDDILYSSAGAYNVLTGGAGNDTFIFTGLHDSRSAAMWHSQIKDFEVGDKIELSDIDADWMAGGNQDFKLVLPSQTEFTDAGQLRIRYEHFDDDDSDHTIVEGNVDDDAEADFRIDVHGYYTFKDTDFVGVS